MLTFFQEPTFRLYYMIGGVALLTLPMLLLARWYHREILKSPGGRELMKRQNRSPVRSRGDIMSVSSQFNIGMGLMKSISRGRFGQHARATQNKAYWIVGFWIAANVVYFGLLIWADEVARSPLAS